MTQQTNNNVSLWKGIFGGILGGIIILIIFFTLQPQTQSVNDTTVYSQEQSQESIQTLTDFEAAITGAVDVAADAVVSINNLQSVQPLQLSNLLEGYSTYSSGQSGYDLENPEDSLVVASVGSGVIYKIDGSTAYVVTNNHVIDGAEKLEVITSDDTTIEAELVGSDEATDLAVLKISSENVTKSIEFADSDEIKVGSLAIAIGSPLGSQFATSVTQGIVSAVERVVQIDADDDGQYDWEMTLLQTDAAINPGNSGGALVNKNGQLIGINSSKLSSTDIEGMGFAIPSNEVQYIITQLENNGKVIRPVLGVAGIIPVSDVSVRSKVEVLGLDQNATEGVVIQVVSPGSAASNAGLQQYDIITSMDGVEVNDLVTLRQLLYQHNVGDTIELNIIRNGQLQTVSVELTESNE